MNNSLKIILTTFIYTFTFCYIIAEEPLQKKSIDEAIDMLELIYESYLEESNSQIILEKIESLSSHYEDPFDIIARTKNKDRENPLRIIKQGKDKAFGVPSSEHLKMLSSIQDKLEPYSMMIIDLSYNGDQSIQSKLSGYALSLKPTESVKRQLLEIAKNNHSAYDALFHLGLFDEEVRSQFIQEIELNDSKENQWDLAFRASQWGLIEALPIYKEMLSIPFNENSISFSNGRPIFKGESGIENYATAATAAWYLGKKAKSLLPLFKDRIEEIKKAFPDHYKTLIPSLELGVQSIERELEINAKPVKNGSGVINLIYNYKPIPYTDLLILGQGSQNNEPNPQPKSFNTLVVIALGLTLVLTGFFFLKPKA